MLAKAFIGATGPTTPQPATRRVAQGAQHRVTRLSSDNRQTRREPNYRYEPNRLRSLTSIAQPYGISAGNAGMAAFAGNSSGALIAGRGNRHVSNGKLCPPRASLAGAAGYRVSILVR